MKSETRIPEGRKKAEIRITHQNPVFGLQSSDFGFLSDFGPPSAFAARHSAVSARRRRPSGFPLGRVNFTQNA
jgi:hypothetical protein